MKTDKDVFRKRRRGGRYVVLTGECNREEPVRRRLHRSGSGSIKELVLVGHS